MPTRGWPSRAGCGRAKIANPHSERTRLTLRRRPDRLRGGRDLLVPPRAGRLLGGRGFGGGARLRAARRRAARLRGPAERPEVQGGFLVLGHLGGRDVAEDGDALVRRLEPTRGGSRLALAAGEGRVARRGGLGAGLVDRAGRRRRRPGRSSSTPECAYLIGPRRRLAVRSCRGNRASVPWLSATACVVPATPAFRPLPGGGSASGAGVTVACTPLCGCVPGCADDLELLDSGPSHPSHHLSVPISPPLRRRSVIDVPSVCSFKADIRAS